MKMLKCLSVLFVSFLFLMTVCAPKVITNISQSYPSSVTADKVRLYEVGEAAPLSNALNLDNEAGVEKSPFEHNTIYANIGYAFVTSKFYLPPGGAGHPKNGLNWQVGHDWISRNRVKLYMNDNTMIWYDKN